MYELVNVFNIFLPQLLLYPNPTDPLNSEAACLHIKDPDRYALKVKEYVKKFASNAALSDSKAVVMEKTVKPQIQNKEEVDDNDELSATSEIEDEVDAQLLFLLPELIKHVSVYQWQQLQNLNSIMEPSRENPPLPTQNCPLPTPRTTKAGPQSEEAAKKKELKELDNKYQTLSKTYKKLEEKYNSCYEKMKSFRKKAEGLEKDLGNSRMINNKLVEEKEELQKQLTKNKEYTRKLETSITLKKPTEPINEKGESSSLKQQLEEERAKNEELALIRESNNEELLRLEALAHNLTIERDSFQKSCQELAQERIDLLDFIEELNGKIEVINKGNEEDFGKLQNELVECVFSLKLRQQQKQKEAEALERANELDEECKNEKNKGLQLQIQIQGLLIKHKELEMEKEKANKDLENIKKEVAEKETMAEDFRKQNCSLRMEYEALKEKMFAVEKAYNMENESLKQSEKCLKEKVDRIASELERASKERDKLKHEIGIALSRCQESIHWQKATPMNTQPRVRKLGIENQAINITPIARVPEYEESGKRMVEEYERWGRSMNSEIQDKYRAEQFKNKMLLVEIKNSKAKYKRKGELQLILLYATYFFNKQRMT
eukprot:TRINITY_DN72679_c0_g1_i1.p1 TRINITY_DN72679_c0_g1~~TRINITY_DN72679_c0_g1_i1.p1  ORF type:complete len:606 (-),score=116.06 TRINITY_DN72679_c0_g1_i1:139-1956(-)